MSKNRKISLAVHLTFVIIPALAALGAGLVLWTDLLGEWFLAVPVVLCVEVVGVIGFIFKLKGIDSPFVPLRHFIPMYSIGTLGYELGAYLTGRNGLELGIASTLFIVAVAGVLFVQCFRKVEQLVVDPVTAAVERATDQAEQFRLPVLVFEAQRAVYMQLAEQLRGGTQNPRVGTTLDSSVATLPADEQAAQGQARLVEELQSRESFERMRADAAHEEVEALRRRLSEVERTQLDTAAPARRPTISQAEVDAIWDEIRAAQPLAAGYEPSGAAVPSWTCAGCGVEGTNAQKGVATKWSERRDLTDLFCGKCRKARG